MTNQKPYHYTECGLEDVYLLNGFHFHETKYGSGVSIDNADKLHDVIGIMLVNQVRPLCGKEIKFLRVELDLSQKTLSNLLGAEVQMVARWENEKTKPEGHGPEDRLFRILYLRYKKNDSDVVEIIERLSALDQSERKDAMLEQIDDDWKNVA